MFKHNPHIGINSPNKMNGMSPIIPAAAYYTSVRI